MLALRPVLNLNASLKVVSYSAHTWFLRYALIMVTYHHHYSQLQSHEISLD